MTRKKQPQVLVTVANFDDRDPIYRPIRTAVPLDKFAPITRDDYWPCGLTPLRDAVSRFLAHLSELQKEHPEAVTVGLLLDESSSIFSSIGHDTVIEQANAFVQGLRVDDVDPDAAGTVICVVQTDGGENCSRETSQAAIDTIVALRKQEGFTMIFMGAGIDAWGTGDAIGFSGDTRTQTVSYNSTPRAHEAATYDTLTHVNSYLSSSSGYHSSDAVVASASRSIADDGSELLTNINEGK